MIHLKTTTRGFNLMMKHSVKGTLRILLTSTSTSAGNNVWVEAQEDQVTWFWVKAK